MCNPADIQHKIHSFTKDGEHIARFLADTLNGKTPGVKVNHRLEAAKHLIRFGFPNADCDTISDRHSCEGRNPEGQGEGGINTSSPSADARRGIRPDTQDRPTDNSELKTENSPVTHLNILNYEIAHLIRHETAEGHTLVNLLIHTMSGRDRPFTPKKFRIKPADRIAAARELLRRGFGELGSRRKQSDTSDEANAYDTLHTDLARRMREYSERGADTIRFLLEVMSDTDPDLEFPIHHRMSAAQELLRRGWDTNYDNIKPKHLQAYWQDKESPRLSIGQKKTQAGISTTIDDYDNYDDTDYEAIAKEIREEEDRDNNSKPLRFQETVPSSLHSSESRNLQDRPAASKSRHSRAGGNPEGQGEAANNPPLPQGEGWGEGNETNVPSTPTLPKSLPQGKSENEPTADRKSIIKEFKEAMDKGDHQAALRAQAKYRRIDVKPEKNIYDYGPSDPDPTIDYYFEPLNPEEQAKFDQEDRREHGLTEDEPATNGSPNSPSPKVATDSLAPIKQAAEAHNTPILPNPLAAKRKNPTIRSP